MRTDWTQFKNICRARSVDMLMVETDSTYHLHAAEGAFDLQCDIDRNPTDLTELNDFETNYKSLCNPKREIVIIPTTPKNEHLLMPHGMERGSFDAVNYACSITLSNKNERTFNYQLLIGITPEVGGYVTNDNCTKRCEIISVNTNTRTIIFQDGAECGCDDGATLENATYTYCKPYIMYCKLPFDDTNMGTREIAPGVVVPSVSFWGHMFNANNYEKNDFLEIGAICKDGLYIEGQEIIPPNGWDYDYDYSWVETLVKVGKLTVKEVDGAPANLPSGFYIRAKYFSPTIHALSYVKDIWIDYIITIKN